MIRLLTVLTSLHFLLLCSCSTMTEEERYQREDKLILAREEFYLQQDSCRQIGGSMQIRLRPVGKNNYEDYKSASCVRIR